LCIEELKLQLLAKSSICPGIITIIWSLITSDIGDDDMMADTDPDDTLTELLNDAETRSAIQQINSNKDDTTEKKDR
jgi:hypothetical protein